MNDRPSRDVQPLGPDAWEAAVQAAARDFPYPPTPDLVRGVRTRLAGAAPQRAGRPQSRLRPLAWGLAALVLILAGLLAVPEVRATIIEVLQIGGIRIFVTPPTPQPTALPPTAPPISAAPAAAAPATAALAPATPAATPTLPRPTATPLASLLDLAGETSLATAQREAGFTIRFPAYPSGLGPPDHVYLQKMGGAFVVLVWTEPGHPNVVRLSLHEFAAGTYADKIAPTVVKETSVNGAPAVWTEGPHLFVLRSGDIDVRELVHGHTLIWEQGGMTYRLETGEDLSEAIRIAESVR
ncbi:MAG: hypothetical protein ACM30E_09120 [Nitrososphaerales archaeon]